MKTNFYINEYIIKITSNNLDDMDDDYGFYYDIENEDRSNDDDKKYRLMNRRYQLHLSEDELTKSRMNLIIINKYNYHFNLVTNSVCIICNLIIIYNLYLFIYSL
jgi:hypothetical protein